jgi:hypothetical protein
MVCPMKPSFKMSEIFGLEIALIFKIFCTHETDDNFKGIVGGVSVVDLSKNQRIIRLTLKNIGDIRVGGHGFEENFAPADA